MIKYVDEFRDPEIAQALIRQIKRESGDKEYTFMEVCGGHTETIYKSGIDKILPENIDLISGPGCPVCVTSDEFVDKSIKLARKDNTSVVTFGDMLKVPGTRSSLKEEKGKGADIRICYSPMKEINIARINNSKEIIFLGVGFETTAPSVAYSILTASKENLDNYYVLSAHKTMPEAMEALLKDKEVNLDGFICPGHVSTIIGTEIYEFIPQDYNIPCVVSGFEPLDMLEAIKNLIMQKSSNEVKVANVYKRSVKRQGNKKAKNIMQKVFDKSTARWRGLGSIPESGLSVKSEFDDFDAEEEFDINVPNRQKDTECICGDIMRGVQSPYECNLFGEECTPESPEGACMVSREGACSTFYKYNRT